VYILVHGAKYGQLISYPITNLKSGTYEVVVSSATQFSVGGSARKVFEVHSKSKIYV